MQKVRACKDSPKNHLGDSELAVQYVYSFFLHVLGFHEWADAKLSDLVATGYVRKPGKEFKAIKFSSVTSCVHDEPDETFSDAIDTDSPAYRTLLQMASSTHFVNDIRRLKEGNVTSFVESYNSVRIHYAPKRKY